MRLETVRGDDERLAKLGGVLDALPERLRQHPKIVHVVRPHVRQGVLEVHGEDEVCHVRQREQRQRGGESLHPRPQAARGGNEHQGDEQRHVVVVRPQFESLVAELGVGRSHDHGAV